MKYLFLTTVLVANLTACSTSSIPQQSAMPNNPLSAEDIQEEVIFRSKEREARNIKIAQPGIYIDPVVAVTLIVDALIDGDLSTLSLDGKTPVEVWLDDLTDDDKFLRRHQRRHQPQLFNQLFNKGMTIPETFHMP